MVHARVAKARQYDAIRGRVTAEPQSVLSFDREGHADCAWQVRSDGTGIWDDTELWVAENFVSTATHRLVAGGYQ